MGQEIGMVDATQLSHVDVHELLPQKEPFVMIGRLVALDNTTTVSETTIAPDNLFVDDGCFSASGMIENVAQTCAARLGYVNKYILKNNIQLGFIGSVKNLIVNKLPQVGKTITTTLVVTNEIYGMTLASAKVECEQKVLLSTDIKIAVKDE